MELKLALHSLQLKKSPRTATKTQPSPAPKQIINKYINKNESKQKTFMELSLYPSGWIQAIFTHLLPPTSHSFHTFLEGAERDPRFSIKPPLPPPTTKGRSEQDLRSPVVPVKTLGPPDQPLHTYIPSVSSSQDKMPRVPWFFLITQNHVSIRPYRFIKLTPSPNP